MLNKVYLIGHLGDDPTIHEKGEFKVANLSIATGFKKDDKEYVEWHRVTVYGKSAENVYLHLKKGRQVSVEGRLRTRKWEKDGVDHWTTEIVAERIIFLGKAPAREGAQPVETQRTVRPAVAARGSR